jgi:hypothetical protein
MRRVAARSLSRRDKVACQLVDVGKMLSAFMFNGTLYLSKAVDEAMQEAEAALSADDYDKAERLARVVSFLVKREAPKFAANPQRWVDRWKELRL